MIMVVPKSRGLGSRSPKPSTPTLNGEKHGAEAQTVKPQIMNSKTLYTLKPFSLKPAQVLVEVAEDVEDEIEASM